MRPIDPKNVRVRLDPESYEDLRRRVLRRDGWRCQYCGNMANLEVHHKLFRDHSGVDSEENPITLCCTCHALDHGETGKIIRSRLVVSKTSYAKPYRGVNMPPSPLTCIQR